MRWEGREHGAAHIAAWNSLIGVQRRGGCSAASCALHASTPRYVRGMEPRIRLGCSPAGEALDTVCIRDCCRVKCYVAAAQ